MIEDRTTHISPRSRWYPGALLGIAVTAVALGTAELAAVATGARSAPLVAVGRVVIDGSPEAVVRFGISLFGRYDKAALLIGTVLLLGAAAAGIGIAALRRGWVGLIGLAGFTAVGVAAAVTRHDAGPLAALPTVVGGVAGAAAFLGLRRLLRRPPPVQLPPREDPPARVAMPDRRGFLRAVGLAVAGAVVVGFAARWLSTRREAELAREAVVLPEPDDPAGRVPASAELGVPGLASYVTGNDTFYRIDTALVPPVVDPDQWELRIHGRVRNPYTIDFATLLARPMVERYVTLACVSNQVGGDLIGNARWLGVPVRELLTAADPLPGADQVVSRSADGWTCGTPTEALLDGRDALLAVGMNGDPLPVEHGFPVRMVVPGLYGYVSACKWITELELSSFDDFDAYWIPRGWASHAPIKTQSRIDTPRRRASAGTVIVAGVAWAQQRGIEAVEVRVDGGPWQEADLAGTVSSDTWRQWSWRWEATPGRHELTVRATDSTGETQPERPSPPAPDGATGWHTVQIEVE